jgi:pyridoxal phosphate enzyme (YggS family)
MAEITTIKENIEKIKEKILNAEIKAGRKENSVALMAVSKFHPAEAVVEAIKANQFLFGENRVQEACGKFPEILQNYENAELHLIGSLQRNKVKQILPIVSCIQSVDRIELLQEIIKQKSKLENNKTLKLFFEVHTGEDSKSGFTDVGELEKALELAGENRNLGIQCAGFMTMAPFTEDKKLIQESFRKLATLSEKLKNQYRELPLDELSMGMSSDFEIAIEEGSTLVRVGTAIFGERQYV